MLWDLHAQMPTFVGNERQILAHPDGNMMDINRANIIGSSSFSGTGWWNGPPLLIQNRYLLERRNIPELISAISNGTLDNLVKSLYDVGQSEWSDPFGSET